MIVDSHTHIGLMASFRYEARSVSDILAACDRAGIHTLLACHHLDLVYGPRAGEEAMRRAYEESGGRILAYCGFDPRLPDSASVGERLLSAPPYVGIKIHPVFHATPAEDPRYADAFALARDAGVPLMSHTWYRSAYNPPQALSLPERFRGHVERFPEVRFILGHGGGGLDGLGSAIEMMRTYPNVHADLAGDVYERGMIRRLAEAAGPERILFASDIPWLDPRAQLGCVLASGLPDDALRLILGGNACRIFRIPQGA
ncbi:MAG: amidohydrolase family protein [Armatimonadetes bacterium]|nr:amidohydrolase family protein [Armatimonadota bacterium]